VTYDLPIGGPVTGCVGGLAAAGLIPGAPDLAAGPLEALERGLGRVVEEGVAQAGDHQLRALSMDGVAIRDQYLSPGNRFERHHSVPRSQPLSRGWLPSQFGGGAPQVMVTRPALLGIDAYLDEFRPLSLFRQGKGPGHRFAGFHHRMAEIV